MILTRTPFRVTLGGGGTDLPSYYERHGGFIFAMSLDKYMYIMVNPPTMDDKIRLHYSQSETVDHVGELRHELAREALRFHGIQRKMEVSSMADLPAGSGVGSSSCYLVGLLNALHHYKRQFVSLYTLAEEACHIELNVLQRRIGRQDQYMAAFGGLTALEIARDGSVKASGVELGASAIAELVANTHIYYTGTRHDAVQMLSDQDEAMRVPARSNHRQVADSLHRIKELGHRSLEAIEGGDFDAWGHLLHEHWQQKKQLSDRISWTKVDEIYRTVRGDYGVLGGKVIGAGGGGFLLVYCPANHDRLDRFMADQGMPRLHYTIEPEGSKVVANVGSTKSMLFHPHVSGAAAGVPLGASVRPIAHVPQ